ncbi:MAG TPA: NAD(P)/FAD-dependent oxidoreductase, partial [Gammaproteobacteria bacterium]|nr:NAD(P)/FAD-dependent oxidoreductase [Gammaproteobacteria bacterium]
LADAVDIDVARRAVVLSDGEAPYDTLVVAVGAGHHYFGHDEWAPLAPGLKTIEDAVEIRRRLLLAFEAAEREADPGARRRQLTFVIVGAGPTGVELAGTIAELAHHTLAADFRHIDPRSAKVILVEAGPRVLPAFQESQSAYAQHSLEKLGVEVRLNAAVTDCDERGVTVGRERIDTGTVIWAAGVAASPAGRWLNVETDRAGRVLVRPDLSIPTDPTVFVIGDAALVHTRDGKRVPGVAPAAKQQGRYVASVIRRTIAGKAASGPFVYRDAGNLATIGRKCAVIELPFITLRGWPAWWLWGIAHIYFLVGVPSPLMVSIRWLWEYLTYGRGARLITGAEHAD